jgi:CRISPR system Cascade subunit CasD
VALQEPRRPLFLGRKCCLPAAPVLLDTVEATSLLDALVSTPRARGSDQGWLPATWWDGDDPSNTRGESWVVPVSDERDWHDRVHVGRRLMRQGHVEPPEPGRA